MDDSTSPPSRTSLDRNDDLPVFLENQNSASGSDLYDNGYASAAASSPSINNVPSAQTQARDVAIANESTERSYRLLINPINTDMKTWWSPRFHSGPHYNIWETPGITNKGITQVSNLPCVQGGSWMLNGENSMNSYNGYLAPYSSVTNQFRGQLLNDPSSVNNLQKENMLSYNRFQGAPGITGLDYFGCLGINDLVLLAKTPGGSLCLQQRLQGPNHKQKQLIFEAISPGIVEVMSDEHGRHVFDKMLDVCNDSQLNIIMFVLEWDRIRFINAAFTKNGSYSIQRLIKKIKKTRHASTIPIILSSRLFELMTDKIGQFIIRQCLNYLENHANEGLFEETIQHSVELATHKFGCVSLNECISNITGSHRERLLKRIADKSDYLSHDPYGNFVIQNVLRLKNEEITNAICERIRDQYINLSLKKGGSHVVEQCIRVSDLGMNLAVKQILRTEKSALQLARDQFGNYVIQAALERTKISNKMMYQYLVMALKPHEADLMRNKAGRHVLRVINDDEGQSPEAKS